MDPLARLCAAIRAISPHAKLIFQGVPHPQTGNGNLWRGMISVGDIVIAEHTDELYEVVYKLTDKLESLTQKLMRNLHEDDDG